MFYFSPGLLGVVIDPIKIGYVQELFGTEPLSVPLANTTYEVMTLVLVFILFGSIWFEIVYPVYENHLVQDTEKMTQAAGIISILFFLYLLVISGDGLFASDKARVMRILGSGYVLWSLSIISLTLLAFATRNWKWFFLGGCFLIFDLFLGFRLEFVLVTLAIFTAFAHSFGHQRLIKKWPLLSMLMTVVVLMVIYKEFLAGIKRYLWHMPYDYIASISFIKAIEHAEPFIIQATLNGVVSHKVHIGIYQYFLTIIQAIPFYGTISGQTIHQFNDSIQTFLFPGIDFGVASNIWAEVYSAGGMMFLVLFMVGYVWALFIGGRWLQNKSLSVRIYGLMVFSYISFYIHRNDIYTTLSYVKLVSFLFVALFVVSRALTFISRYRPKWLVYSHPFSPR